MTIQPFSFIANSDGQTLFGPIIPISIPTAILAKNGVMQNELNGDFSVSGGFYITIPQGVQKGDEVSGKLFIC